MSKRLTLYFNDGISSCFIELKTAREMCSNNENVYYDYACLEWESRGCWGGGEAGRWVWDQKISINTFTSVCAMHQFSVLFLLVNWSGEKPAATTKIISILTLFSDINKNNILQCIHTNNTPLFLNKITSLMYIVHCVTKVVELASRTMENKHIL